MFASRHVLHQVLHLSVFSLASSYAVAKLGCYQVADGDPEYTSGDRAIYPIAILLLQGELALGSDKNPF